MDRSGAGILPHEFRTKGEKISSTIEAGTQGFWKDCFWKKHLY